MTSARNVFVIKPTVAHCIYESGAVKTMDYQNPICMYQSFIVYADTYEIKTNCAVLYKTENKIVSVKCIWKDTLVIITEDTKYMRTANLFDIKTLKVIVTARYSSKWDNDVIFAVELQKKCIVMGDSSFILIFSEGKTITYTGNYLYPGITGYVSGSDYKIMKAMSYTTSKNWSFSGTTENAYYIMMSDDLVIEITVPDNASLSEINAIYSNGTYILGVSLIDYIDPIPILTNDAKVSFVCSDQKDTYYAIVNIDSYGITMKYSNGPVNHGVGNVYISECDSGYNVVGKNSGHNIATLTDGIINKTGGVNFTDYYI